MTETTTLPPPVTDESSARPDPRARRRARRQRKPLIGGKPMSSSPEPAVLTEQLERRFGDNEAVAGVDLRVDPGEIYGFLVSNGAGKSTTVKMLCTLIAPTGGRAQVAGRD